MKQEEVAVFDRRYVIERLIEPANDWQPPKQSKIRGRTITVPTDGPTVEWRISAQAARITSNKFSGQAANDNEAWPLAKLLRTEGNTHCLELAEHYRDIYGLAHMPELKGTAPDDLYVVHDTDEEGRDKGPKRIIGRKSNQTTAPRRNAKPVVKAWSGDWPILAAIDARRELAYLRAKLAYVPKIIDAFELAVIDGLTLYDIGLRLGAGTKGAKGEARARIFDGFEIVDRYWRVNRAA